MEKHLTLGDVLDRLNLEALGLDAEQLVEPLVRTYFQRPNAPEARDQLKQQELLLRNTLKKLNCIQGQKEDNRAGARVDICELIGGDANSDNLWAITILQNVRTNGTTASYVFNNLGCAYMWLGELDSAQKAFQEALGPYVPDSQPPSSDVGSGTSEVSPSAKQAAKGNLRVLREFIQILAQLQLAKRNLWLAR